MRIVKNETKTTEQLAIAVGFYLMFDGSITKYGRLYKTHVHKNYKEISFRYNKKTYHCQVHRLQAYIKYGNIMYEKGILVRHLNGNSLDNSWDNIAIGTAYDNAQDIPLEKRLERGRKIHETRKRNNSYPKHYNVKDRTLNKNKITVNIRNININCNI